MAKSKVKYTSFTAQVYQRALAAERMALWKLGQIILDNATPDVPIETGTLRRSGVVSTQLPNMRTVYDAARAGAVDRFGSLGAGLSVPSVTNKQGKVSSTAGGLVTMYVSYNTPYAARLHENTKWTPRAWKYLDTGKRPRPRVAKPAVGRPKYLFIAAQKAKPFLSGLLAKEMKAAGF
jgi:hypothetical protein